MKTLVGTPDPEPQPNPSQIFVMHPMTTVTNDWVTIQTMTASSVTWTPGTS